jgi:hypothetical protein
LIIVSASHHTYLSLLAMVMLTLLLLVFYAAGIQATYNVDDQSGNISYVHGSWLFVNVQGAFNNTVWVHPLHIC